MISPAEIATQIKPLGEQIGEFYKEAERPPVLVGILKGAFIFLADLVRAIPIDVEVAFITASSYGSGTESSGQVRILGDPDLDALRDRDVVLVDDILETGLTLRTIRTMIWRNFRPRSIESCVLLAKGFGPAPGVEPPRWVGFAIAPQFVVGYGLDHAELHRNEPGIRILKQ